MSIKEIHVNIRHLMLIASLASPALLVGCGEKKPTGPAEGEVLSPKRAFDNGVTILKTPNKDGDIDYAGAYASFQQAIQGRPDFARAHFNAGWVAEAQGKLGTAAEHYGKASALKPDNKRFMFAHGDLLSRSGNGDQAVALYRAYVEKAPEDLEARNALMEALTEGDYYDDAIGEAKTILMSEAKNVGAYRNLSRLYFAKCEYKMSQLCAEKAKELAAGDAGIYNNIGVTYLVMDNEALAIGEFKTAIQFDPDNLEANLNLGLVALNSGDYDLAKGCFEAALSAMPGSVESKLGMAVALRGLKDYANAEKLYDEVMDADPGNQKAYFNASDLQAKYTKNFKKAEKILQDYVNTNNTDGTIGPDHIVFAKIKKIKEYQELERQRIEADKRREAEEKARLERAKKLMDDLKARVKGLQGLVDANSSCEDFMMGIGDEADMVIEQANMVIEAEEFDMAGDVLTFVEQIQPMAEEIAATCGGAAAPPAEGGGEAPPAEAPPAEAPPADGG
jgi:tetratricopeptide (TPR) repeat protein